VGFLLLSKENKLDLLIGKGKIYLIEGRFFVKKNLQESYLRGLEKPSGQLRNAIGVNGLQGVSR